MPRTDTAARLVLIEESQARIELALTLLIPPADLREVMDDMLSARSLIGQLCEVAGIQRDELRAHVRVIDRMIEDGRVADAELHSVLVQLAELSRTHVRGLTDLERALNWRRGDVDRRRIA